MTGERGFGPTEVLDNLASTFAINFVATFVESVEGAFGGEIGQDSWCAMAGTSDEQHVAFVLVYQVIEVGVDEIEARNRAPVAEDAGLEVFRLQIFFQEKIVLEVELGGTEIIRIAKIFLDPTESLLISFGHNFW